MLGRNKNSGKLSGKDGSTTSAQRTVGNADFNLMYRRIHSASSFEDFGARDLSHACRLKSALQQNKFCATAEPALYAQNHLPLFGLLV
jgi:hypothetical protein